jgi:hypothetical protein
MDAQNRIVDTELSHYSLLADNAEFLAADGENRFIRGALDEIARNYRLLADQAARHAKSRSGGGDFRWPPRG